MITRIRKAMQEKDRGFTLIELLVVVIIIGILAAIAIPLYMNQKSKAFDATVKADLKSIATQMETVFTDKNEYPTVAVSSLPSSTVGLDGFQKSDGNSFHVLTVSTGTTAGFVVYGSNKNSSVVYVLSSYGGSKPQATTATAAAALALTAPTVDSNPAGALGAVPAAATWTSFDK